MLEQSRLPARILLVDDEQAIHSAYRTILVNREIDTALDELEAALFGDDTSQSASTGSDSDWQYDLLHTMQGLEAIELVARELELGQPCEVAFVDMRMPPGINGLETIERLWQVDPQLQVVMCTAFSDYSWSEVIGRLGLRDNLLLLKKPFANEEVLQLANALTQKRRAEIENCLQLERLQDSNRRLCQEIIHRKSAEDRLQHAATHDQLTKLPNRNYLRSVLAERFEATDKSKHLHDAIIFLDLDNFKTINDNLGHVVGDELLIQVAHRLQSVLCGFRTDVIVEPGAIKEAPHSLVARLGGDEFVALLLDSPHRDEVIGLSEMLLTHLSSDYEIGTQVVHIGVSLGIAYTECGTIPPAELMRNADLAMYRAKYTGKSRIAVFDREMHAAVMRRLELEAALTTVLKEGGLRLVYQPIFNVKDGRTIGLEALLRWNHDALGDVSPLEFIPVAEETGLIVSIGRWVIQEACRTIAMLNQTVPHLHPLSVAVNVSKRQIVDPGFVKDVEHILATNGVSGKQLTLEITESLIMDNPEDIVDRLHEIRALGIRLYMDDFGTGHSSLSCLHRFPIDVLKIDRSFVSTMESNDDYESIIHAIITLAHNLNTTVVAEGIETQWQLSRLRDLDCDLGQGFLFSEPKPLTEIMELLCQPGSVEAGGPPPGSFLSISSAIATPSLNAAAP